MMPRTSHPVVHPEPAQVEAPALPAPAPAQGPAEAPPGVEMTGRPPCGQAALRLLQAILAFFAAFDVMDYAGDFASRYFVSAAALQCLWSLAVAILYFYALLVGRSFRSARAVAILGAGDWITATLTFSASCSAAAITVLSKHNMEFRYVNRCPSDAIVMAFLSWFLIAPCCVYHLGALVYKLQRL